MISLQDIEQVIPFIKPLFDGLRSARGFFTRSKPKKSEHSIDIPKQTLILLPDVNPHALRWSRAKWGDKEGMQINGRLQATNTSPFGIRAAGIRLLSPAGVEPIMQMVSTKDHDSGVYDTKHLIPARSIGDLIFNLHVMPITGTLGEPLTIAISVLDQFGNEHVRRNLECRYIGPEKVA